MNITENSDGSGLAIHTFLDRDSPESATIVRAFKVLTMVPLSFVFSDRNFFHWTFAAFRTASEINRLDSKPADGLFDQSLVFELPLLLGDRRAI
jgi:hypothetical protein